MNPSNFFEVLDGFDYDGERQKFVKNIDMLKAMSVQEHTLYKKWQECKYSQSRLDSSVNTAFDIWRPRDIYDIVATIKEIEELNPIVVEASNELYSEHWMNLRTYTSSFAFDMSPGRFLKFLLIDANTEKYLGTISIASDVPDLYVRDQHIGWGKKDKYGNGRLRCTCIGSSIIPTQPFGYNFIGGKLTAAVLSTKIFRDVWKREYDDTLVGVTTTSLYGMSSMYNAIPYWKTLGESSGKIFIKPDLDVYDVWHHWYQEHYPIEYKKMITPKEGVGGPPTGLKQKILYAIFKQLNLNPQDYTHGYKRGVFFLPMYENTKEFLNSKISEDQLQMKERVKLDMQGVLDWWKPKAIKRYESLHQQNKLRPETLYYNKISFMTWEECKSMYLPQVGR